MDADQLVALVKRRAYLPTAAPQFTDGELRAFCDEALVDGLLADLLDVRESHLAQTWTVPLVALQATYKLPPRATGGTVLWVRYLDSAGSQITYPLPHADETDLPYYPQTPSSPYGSPWFFDGDHLTMVTPPASATGSLIIRYCVRPSSLVPPASTTAITVATSATQFTTAADPTTIGITTGTKIDVVGVDGVHDFRIIGGTASVSGHVITVTGGTGLADQAVGDLVSLAGQTSVPNIPDEGHQLLGVLAAARVCRAMKDYESASALEGEAEEMKPRTMDLMSPRSVKQTKRVINRNSPVRSRRGRAWWWW